MRLLRMPGFHTDTIRAAVYAVRGMLMDDLAKKFTRMTKILQNINDWKQEDVIRYYAALADFLDRVEPLIDKYDMSKPKKFIFRRLDELDT